MKCKICNQKQQCNFCDKSVERNTLTEIKVNMDVEESILYKQKLNISSEDTISYYMCMTCLKDVLKNLK